MFLVCTRARAPRPEIALRHRAGSNARLSSHRRGDKPTLLPYISPVLGKPIVWHVSLSSSADDVFELVDTDAGRERFWALRSREVDGGFELAFPGGLESRVEVIDRRPPERLAIRYFGSKAELEVTPQDEGCVLTVTCRCDDEEAWLEFYAGWVSWLLTLKAAADFNVDLRNNTPGRTWDERFVDP